MHSVRQSDLFGVNYRHVPEDQALPQPAVRIGSHRVLLCVAESCQVAVQRRDLGTCDLRVCLPIVTQLVTHERSCAHAPQRGRSIGNRRKTRHGVGMMNK
jgi:hypothetical protein